MHPGHSFLISLVSLLAITGLISCGAEDKIKTEAETDSSLDWPQWRGPQRDGHSPETGLLETWPAEGPELVWRRPVGAGFSGLSIVAGRVFTAWVADDAEILVALGADDGEELWRQRLSDAFHEEYGNGPRSTPTVADGVVYAMSSTARFFALRAHSGEVLWQIDLFAELVDPKVGYGRGYASSPLVHGDLVVVQIGPNPGSTVVALNRHDGSITWRAHGGRAAFSSPIAVTLAGEEQIVSASAYGLLGLSPATGEALWGLRWKTPYDLNIATPIFVPPDRFFLSSGYDTGAVFLRVTPALNEASNQWNTETLWTQIRFRNHFNSSVHHQGNFYGFDNAILKCIDGATGEECWKARGFGKGSLIAVGGLLIVLGDDGHLGLVRATPESYEELAKHPVLSGKCWTAPSLANGRLYLRNQEELVVLKVN